MLLSRWLAVLTAGCPTLAACEPLEPVPWEVENTPFVGRDWSRQRMSHRRTETRSLLPKNPHIAGFDLYLLLDGTLALWHSIPADPSSPITPRLPDRAPREANLQSTGTRYLGVPSRRPKLDIEELLRRAAQQGWADLDGAHEVRIKRLVQGQRLSGAETTESVWIISLRGKLLSVDNLLE
jgi:hypothetical protein